MRLAPRLMTVAFALAAGCARAQTGAPAPAPAKPALSTATQTINTMNTLWGRHPGMRANHAKGVVAYGTFVPSRHAASLSKASIFAGPPVAVTVRFSDSTGLPTLPDGAPNANPHGMAIRFSTTSGAPVDVVTNSLAFFPVATGEDFLSFLNAAGASGPNAPKPTALDRFIAAHPAVPRALATVATPSSFARETYNGVDAFIFVDAAGHRQPFRFKITPVAGTQHLTEAEAAKMKPDFLIDELPKRLATKTVAFHLLAQLAKQGDPTSDPTVPWPASRKLADLGTITLTKAAPDQAKAQHDLRYLPNQLEPGIEVSDDKLIDARVRAYVISFGRRI
jgi:catalase